jgi:hypothetical protein
VNLVRSIWFDPLQQVKDLVSRGAFPKRLPSAIPPPTLGDGNAAQPSMSVEILSEEPMILRVNHFLSPAEADHLVAVGTPLLQTSKLQEGRGGA